MILSDLPLAPVGASLLQPLSPTIAAKNSQQIKKQLEGNREELIGAKLHKGAKA